MTKLFRDRGATGQPQQDWPWRGFRVFGEPAPRQSAPLLTQGTLIDRSVTVEVDSRPISSGVVGPGCVPLTGGWPVQVFNADPFGAYLQLAQNIGQLCAFTVFDRSDALVSTNADPVASAGPGMSVNYTNTRSGAKLVLAADPACCRLPTRALHSVGISSTSVPSSIRRPSGSSRCAASSNVSPPPG